MAEGNDLFELNEEHSSYGDRLANRYISYLRDDIDPPDRPLPLNINDNISNDDIDQSMSTFKRILILARRYSDGIPTLKLKSYRIPIDIFFYLENLNRFAGITTNFEYEQYYRYRLLGLFNRGPMSMFNRLFRELANQQEIEMVSRGQIFDLVFEGLRTFLSYRAAGNNALLNNRNLAFGNVNNLNYYSINLTTRHHGLQIEASPAYFLSWSYFGHPTSPLTGPLQPGWYLFGGKGPSLPTFTHDTTIIKIPPHVNINLQGI